MGKKRRDKQNALLIISSLGFGLLMLVGCTIQPNNLPANAVTLKVTPVASRSRPSYILDISPAESLMIPLHLYEVDKREQYVEETGTYIIGVRRAESGYNSSICIEVDLTDLIEPGDDFREVSSVTKRIIVTVDGRVLTQVIDWSYLPGFFMRGTAKWGGPYTYCWSAPLEIGVHEVVFQFQQTHGRVRSYRWNFTITKD